MFDPSVSSAWSHCANDYELARANSDAERSWEDHADTDAWPSDRLPRQPFGRGLRQHGIPAGASGCDGVRERVDAFGVVACSLGGASVSDGVTDRTAAEYRAAQRRCRRGSGRAVCLGRG